MTRENMTADEIIALLPPDFGQGWMTKSARDLVKIAVYVAGVDAKVLISRLARAGERGANINAATVQRVLGEMREKK